MTTAGQLDRDIRELITRRVEIGFESYDDIMQAVVDIYSDTYPGENLETFAEQSIREVLQAHYARQQGWIELTDCDRLNLVFEELNQRGVVARQDFACCNTCGFAEIWDEIEVVGRNGKVLTGFAFYHQQSTEYAYDYGRLGIGYGSTIVGDETLTRDIGKVLVEVLKLHGFTPEWTGDPAKQVILKQLNWKRRRPVEIPD